MAQVSKSMGKWRVSGDLMLDDIESMLETETFDFDGAALEIDLSAVNEVDSIAISLLFEWLRRGHSKRCEVVYANLPLNLVDLAKLYGVLDLIPQATSQTNSH